MVDDMMKNIVEPDVWIKISDQDGTIKYYAASTKILNCIEFFILLQEDIQ